MDDLKSKLASQEVELAEKNKEANDLIAIVSAETEKVTSEKTIADGEEIKVSEITVEVEQKASDCQRDLAKAEPALLAAKEALNTLNKVYILALVVKVHVLRRRRKMNQFLNQSFLFVPFNNICVYRVKSLTPE